MQLRRAVLILRAHEKISEARRCEWAIAGACTRKCEIVIVSPTGSLLALERPRYARRQTCRRRAYFVKRSWWTRILNGRNRTGSNVLNGDGKHVPASTTGRMRT